MAATSAARRIDIDPERAWGLWTNVSRWPTFVEGFAHAAEQSPEWPSQGAKIVWNSTPGGRGRVTEKVLGSEPGQSFVTQIFEEALAGTQFVRFGVADDGRTRVELRLEYTLSGGGPLKAVMDALFIRRALAQALQRTLARFAAEAAEEAAL